MSYLTQMAGLTVQNFVSSAAGIAMAIALIRGFARREAKGIGNFWVDLTRATLYVMLPLSIVVALALIAFGMPQNLGAYTEATTLEGAKQVIAQGPVASQIAIKQLGTNGGGFFNVNSSHPFENPNAVTNLIEMWSILVDQRGAHLHLRPHGAGYPPGLGAACGHGHPVPRRRCDVLLVRIAWQSGLCRLQCRHRARATCKPAAIWKARRFASGLPTRRSGRPRRPTPPMALSIRCMTATCRSAAWCRWSTSCWARSFLAASARVSTAFLLSPSSRCSSPV